MADSSLLKHEQGHFDITAIYALQLKNALAKFTSKHASIEKEISTIAQKILDEEEDIQRSYDEETNFGKNRVAQAKWLEKIAKELSGNMTATGK